MDGLGAITGLFMLCRGCADLPASLLLALQKVAENFVEQCRDCSDVPLNGSACQLACLLHACLMHGLCIASSGL